jgi:hypothetical protein
LRGKSWSVEEERLLRQLVEEGKSFDEISRIMGKSRLSIKGKIFNLGLNSLVVATGVQKSVATATIATTTPDPAAASELTLEVSKPNPKTISSQATNVSGVDLRLPEELPSVEEELKILAAAIEALRKPGLSRSEVSRLLNIISAVKIYQELFARYVNYRGLETEVLELRRQLASERSQV